MKSFIGFLFLLLIGTTSFVLLGYSSKGGTTPNGTANAVVLPEGRQNTMTLTVKSRKLQGNMYDSQSSGKGGNANLEDYGAIDPVPSSVNSIRHGPIQHGTPLMPYIPNPAPPPTQSKHVGFP